MLSQLKDRFKHNISTIVLFYENDFSQKDIRRLTEVFTRMFHDPQTKVFSLFVEVLVEFIEEHNEDIEEWLPVCLDRLLTRLGSDLLGSVHNKVLRALETIRYHITQGYRNLFAVSLLQIFKVLDKSTRVTRCYVANTF